MNKTLVKILLIFFIIKCYNLTQCHVQTYLAIANIDRSIVESLLTPGFSLSETHPYQSLMSLNEYPLIFEFGKQNDCWMISTITKHSFLEFKLEIPFVKHSDGAEGKVFKSVIFADNYMDVYGSRIIYGLNSLKAEIKMTDNKYEITTEKGKITASFDSSILDLNSYTKIEKLNYFKEISTTPWYCYSMFGNLKCANIKYIWKDAKIKPIKINVKIEGEILSKKLDRLNFTTKDINEFELGSAEIFVDIDISLPYQCQMDKKIISDF